MSFPTGMDCGLLLPEHARCGAWTPGTEQVALLRPEGGARQLRSCLSCNTHGLGTKILHHLTEERILLLAGEFHRQRVLTQHDLQLFEGCSALEDSGSLVVMNCAEIEHGGGHVQA